MMSPETCDHDDLLAQAALDVSTPSGEFSEEAMAAM